jgi:hypothetical protein
MENARLRCDNCGELMAVDPDFPGLLVQCPHCQHVVQTPDLGQAPRTSSPAGLLEEDPTRPLPAGGDDIFTQESHTGGEDNFNAGCSSRPVDLTAEQELVDQTEILEPKPVDWEPLSNASPIEQTVTMMGPGQEGPSLPGAVEPAPAPEPAPATLTVARRTARHSVLSPILLIFLVPYAVVTTGFIVWQWYHQQRTFDPMERLPDPKPGDGGARRLHPHAPMPAKLKTSLGQPLQVGDLKVTPLRIMTNADRQMGLHLKLQNLSPDVEFKPLLPNGFYQLKRVSLLDTGPYTYLEVGGKRLYGLGAEWEQTPARRDDGRFDGTLQPGEAMTAVFWTRTDDKAVARAVDGARGPLLWRVQLRRGLVAVGGTEVSATAVIGVAFNARDIGSEQGEIARLAKDWSGVLPGLSSGLTFLQSHKRLRLPAGQSASHIGISFARMSHGLPAIIIKTAKVGLPSVWGTL